MPFSCPDFGASKIGQKLFKIPGGTIIIRFRSCEGTQGLTRRNRGHFGWGAIITLDTNCTFTNIPGPGVRTANFAAFGSWSEALLKDTESLRDSDALMRVAVPRRRGPAGPRNLFVSDEITVFTPCAQGFLRVRGMGGITTLGALCVLLKRRTAACQKGSFAAF